MRGWRSCDLTVASVAAPRFADLPAINGPVAMFLDVDGTLLDLAERPELVLAPAGLISTLARIESQLGGALALISGRSLGELDRLFEPLRLRASAVHGAETRFDPGGPTIRSPQAAELPGSLWTALTQAIAAFPGVFAENKRYSFAVHYRLAPEAGPAVRETIMRLVEAKPRIPVEVMAAHCAVELKAPGYDKGRAIASFLSEPVFAGRAPVFIGDDTTDEAGFAVVSARGGLAYSVGHRRPGTIGVFDRPRDVRDWLAAFAEGRDGV